MKLKCLLILFLFSSPIIISQENNFIQEEVSVNQFIDGTLLIPSSNKNASLAIIIGDSGPTDRNGNQNFQKNNILKKLAEELSNNGIATFRYDKRIVKQIRKGSVSKTISFEDFINDAISTVSYFTEKNTFKNIYIIGHGQGSLVGILASKENISGYISIAGSAKPIDEVILDQVEQTVPGLTDESQAAFKKLKEGKTTTNYPSALESIFSIENQPFMSSWMQYHPQEQIADLTIPTLIINGTKDLQVPIEEAHLLKDASKEGSLEIIENMNHVMFSILGDDLENSKSYNESFRTLSPELIPAILEFIK
ncbi:alpha/beta hydrolase [Xanthomarina sp. F2636L]|uniref:alpha/beta hydrolase n=1 Tax=Xanthomarina sp. F2636L TaxID=2996018 RepID=UPI00225E4AA3|nr:alpha/beta hydrolase [Xanthomarina sp. F2636L]MCX7550614.1 alpha/beta hydrolase [Xanthomarina sp. F2636L]